MRIGILTFIHTNNFGANLQCYALQHVIKRMGFSVDVIDLYRPHDKGYLSCVKDKERFGALYSYHSLRDYRSRFNKIIMKFILSLKRRKVCQDNEDGFEKFRKTYIHLTSKSFRNITQLYEEFPAGTYTHIVVGSDQVWNYTGDFSKEPFFLTFDNQARKISYAASLGHSTIPQKVAEKYSQWLKDFYCISVREESGVAAISKIVDRDVVQTIDPTFLLSKGEWLKAFSIDRLQYSENIVLVYMLSLSIASIELAQTLARLLGCSVKIITDKPVIKKFENCEFLHNQDPCSFISLYRNAKFVVTNSFHGTAFAINFNIPFITIDKKGARLNTRKVEILKQFNLLDRYIVEGDLYNASSLLKCDFTFANKIMYEERNKSIYFLTKSFEV